MLHANIGMRQLLTLLLCLSVGSGIVRGQLSDMIVEGIDVTGKVEDGPVNEFSKKPWALIVLDINDGAENNVNDKKITVLKQMNVTLPYADDKLYDAYAGAWAGNYAKAVTLHHPDFNNCKASFADFLGEKQLEGGTVYKIRLKLPSSGLIEANKSFNEMDFETASRLYSQIATNPESDREEKLIATNHLNGIDSLISFHGKALEYEKIAASSSGKERDRALYRARIFYNRIYKECGVVKAGVKLDEIKNLLGVKSESSRIPGINVIKKVSASMAGNDLRASGNDAVTYDYTGDNGKKVEKRKSALLIIEVPLNGMMVKSDRLVGEVREKNGENWLYVKTEMDDKEHNPDPVLFTIEHPDYVPFEFRLSDFDDDSDLSPQKVYKIKLETPTLIMVMANKQLASLDLAGARNLFRYNYSDGDEQQYAESCRNMLESAPVKDIIPSLEEDTRKCRSVEKEYFSIITGGTKFSSMEERNKRLKAVNSQLEEQAGILARQYRTIYDEALSKGIELTYALDLSSEFTNIKKGVRRLPLIIEFKEMKDMGNGVYSPVDVLSTAPTVSVEFIDGNGKTVDNIVQQVKSGKISFMANISSSLLFSRGIGKIKISTPKDMNFNSKNKKYTPYKNATLDISNFKIDDFTTKRLNVTLIKK